MRRRDLVESAVLVAALQTGLGAIFFFLSGSTPGVNLRSIGMSIALLVAVSSSIGVGLYWLIKRFARERTIKTAMMTMTDDEQRVMREVMRRGKVRQDDLNRWADCSKSKLSALVSNLVDKGTVERVRHKRTNLLSPTEDFR